MLYETGLCGDRQRVDSGSNRVLSSLFGEKLCAQSETMFSVGILISERIEFINLYLIFIYFFLLFFTS